ncbi:MULTISPECIES: thiamine pyrophosphate-binding protein [unclassified Bradyrhizobium]|uniref:thiamine pyrophosphate-binding protein n=1 Tax=unclassified Bradyrhizobium TaxID=2631580 RepID=UPI001BA7D2B9|nr:MULTISPECIES: thiamine pyrophosphate-binding protein [unclassified Bradyrhizobium]MBR1202963.1 thiamine pyrophosphate-binding protein [Bradyrhizobium sp. AUGA SZCCT0124]MBR1314377.1 thiamine pyrophosphate-binding protein [Bradyrhizobium sp. AUGA SZCCT0051]MBR1342605.1 thiamine pyrophosphate-binding protein [Bradyrhizobium sp. AUGA SZCCT0105]MBR1352834.1 thiamine pyrophosphate-binding protein [Bradyrhizobium sp. AUGA SZCCT0045]
MGRISGGAALAQTLRALDVTEVFTLHGGHLDAFLVACPDAGIRLTDMRNEASAGHAAEAYGRATEKLGVAVITAGPGFTNALTAVASAWLDASPVLFIAGSPPLREVATNPLQGGFDQVAMAAPVTKWAHRITHADRIPDLVDKAARMALSGRPGPVFLEVPIDVMFAPVESDRLVFPEPYALTRPSAPADAIDRLLDMLARAERPVIIAGGGAISAACAVRLKTFAARTKIPVAVNGKALGVLAADHPQNVGMVGVLATTATIAKQKPDVVLQLGARAGLFLGGRSGTIVPHDAKLAQIDIDGAEIGRLKAADLGIVADCGEALAVMLDRADKREWRARDEWTDLLRKCGSAAITSFRDAPHETQPGLLHPFHAARAVAEALTPDTAVVLDGGEAPSWVRPFLKSPGPGLALGNGYLGCLGIGQGFAIGLARARPSKPVALVIGDGSAGFNIAEFDTMARHRLPIVTIIYNNACWGMSQHGQEIIYGRQHLAAVKLAASDYHLVAQGFGCGGEKVTRYEDIGPAVRRAQATGLPACINLLIDPDIVHPVTTAMMGAMKSNKEIAIPYYENIPGAK